MSPAARSATCTALAALALAPLQPAQAGRPLSVDDANPNDAGHAHVEFWVSRAPGSTVFNIAPAYTLRDGLELSLSHAHERRSAMESTALQLKWVATASQEQGCNLAFSGGHARITRGGGHGNFLNGIGTCNGLAGGSVHVNLGLVRQAGETVRTWGLAYERPWGAVTPHLEWFGAEALKPTAQFGLRGEVAKGWQLDGTVGRHDRGTLWSLGAKYEF